MDAGFAPHHRRQVVGQVLGGDADGYLKDGRGTVGSAPTIHNPPWGGDCALRRDRRDDPFAVLAGIAVAACPLSVLHVFHHHRPGTSEKQKVHPLRQFRRVRDRSEFVLIHVLDEEDVRDQAVQGWQRPTG